MKLFKCPADYVRFLYKMEVYRAMYKINIVEFCLMSNHFHLLVQEPSNEKQILITSKFLQRLQNSYGKYFALKYGHSGRVFQGTYKNKIITDNNHFLTVQNYVIENPVRKKLVDHPAKWPYSSASVYQH